MRVIVQRSLQSSVSIEGNIVGSIDKGYVLLVGFTHNDTEEDVDYIINKILNLRVFEDESGKRNLSISDIGGSILSISQFTLYGDTRKGNRPSFIDAMNPSDANKLYELFNSKLSEKINVSRGVFGADMKVSILNDGPVTIMLESGKVNDKK